MSQQNIERSPRIGEIYMMTFSGNGCEQYGLRPGLVFQNNVGNLHSPNIIALPLTGSIKKMNQPTHVLLRAQETGLRMDSVVLCENPERMSKDKIGKYITTLSPEDMEKVTEASLIATSAISFLSIQSLLRVWQIAKELNKVPAPT